VSLALPELRLFHRDCRRGCDVFANFRLGPGAPVCWSWTPKREPEVGFEEIAIDLLQASEAFPRLGISGNSLFFLVASARKEKH
jgi:hypothetical protein